MLISYARVSTDEQNTKLQIDALKRAGCKRLFEEKASGACADRPELAKAMAIAREKDVLVVWKLDRLGRWPPQVPSYHASLGGEFLVALDLGLDDVQLSSDPLADHAATDRDLARVALLLSLDRKGQAASQRDPFSWWWKVVQYFASCP